MNTIALQVAIHRLMMAPMDPPVAPPPFTVGLPKPDNTGFFAPISSPFASIAGSLMSILVLIVLPASLVLGAILYVGGRTSGSKGTVKLGLNALWAGPTAVVILYLVIFTMNTMIKAWL